MTAYISLAEWLRNTPTDQLVDEVARRELDLDMVVQLLGVSSVDELRQRLRRLQVVDRLPAGVAMSHPAAMIQS